MGNVYKFVGWDADFYNELPDDDCIVCLTEKQIYLVGQIITQLGWATRWEGDTSGLDLKGIAGNLEKALAERMTCQNLQKILDTVQALEIKIDNYIDPAPDFDVDITVLNDSYTDSELAEIGYDSGTCTDDDKSALYSGINTLVRYMHQKNVDNLEQITQLANLPQRTDLVIDAIPVVNQLAFDEAARFVAFFIEEMLEEYNATVTEELLQTVVCDLFCIAINSGCRFNFYDVYAYFAAKVEPTLSNATTVFVDLVQYALSGTLSGDTYYYFLTYFQLWLAGAAQKYFDVTTLTTYISQYFAGINSPDSDWEIFCLTCPTQYRLYSHKFSQGLGDWTLLTGTQTGGRIQGADVGTSKAIAMTLPQLAGYRVKGANVYLERVDGANNGGTDTILINWRATAGTNVGNIAQFPGAGFQPNGVLQSCEMWITAPQYITGCVEAYLEARVTDNATSQIYVDRVDILYEVAHAPAQTSITEDNDLCS